MASDMPKWARMLLMVALITITKSCLGGAMQHIVGGSTGWDLATNFRTWEAEQTFNVGDTLLFKYTAGLHNVVELGSEADYKSCSVGSQVNSWKGGTDVVKLDKAGTRYFACGTAGHCSAGMKFQATVLSEGAKSPIPSAPSNTATSSPTKPKPNASHAVAVSPSPSACIIVFFGLYVALMWLP